MKYHVFVEEVHRRRYEAEAESPESAIAKVLDGKCRKPDDSHLEFSHTRSADCWYVEDDDGNLVLPL